MGCITITTKAEITPPPIPQSPEREIPWGSIILGLAGLAFAYLALKSRK